MNAPTAESPDEQPGKAEVEILRLWDLSAIKEYLKRIWTAMHGQNERGPIDYDPLADERRILVNIIKEQVRHSGSSGGHGGVHETKWSTWILGIVGVLIAAGILGLTSAMFTMTGRLSSLETKVDMLVAKDRK